MHRAAKLRILISVMGGRVEGHSFTNRKNPKNAEVKVSSVRPATFLETDPRMGAFDLFWSAAPYPTNIASKGRPRQLPP